MPVSYPGFARLWTGVNAGQVKQETPSRVSQIEGHDTYTSTRKPDSLQSTPRFLAVKSVSGLGRLLL